MQRPHVNGGAARPHVIPESSIAGEFPPLAGERWVLNEKRCQAELTTGHPVLGTRKYHLLARTGALIGRADDQFDVALALQCVGARADDTPIAVHFRSVTLSRAAPFRYHASGQLRVGTEEAFLPVNIHDLSWVSAGQRADEERILTFAATLDRALWDRAESIHTPPLIRPHAEIFVHTHWREAPVPPEAA